jgi:hypothetical protein
MHKKTLPFLEKESIGKCTPILEKLKGRIVPKTVSNMPLDVSCATWYVSLSLIP